MKCAGELAGGVFECVCVEMLWHVCGVCMFVHVDRFVLCMCVHKYGRLCKARVAGCVSHSTVHV